jgi:outer membrane receptor protein involved in Fe transport
MNIHKRSALMIGASNLSLGLMLTVCGSASAIAQEQGGQPAQVEQVTVTGSRLTTGMETPTPVTVVSVEDLQQASPNNLSDSLNQLPAFGGSTSTNNPGTGLSGGTMGQNILNLRGLGDNRNLVLLDGHRLVSTNTENSVDINVIPQNLVSRVDIVTGGASAAYGSDAVTGVVNFVLNTKFEGLKGELGGGISTYGDLPSYKGSLAWGSSFLGGRLRAIASASFFNQSGLPRAQLTGRNWYDNAPGLLPNLTGSGPTNIIVPSIRSAIGTAGGLISAGTLRGTQFVAGGSPANFNFGFNSGTVYQSGGDGSRPEVGFAPAQWRTANFGHVEYDLTPEDTLYAQGLYSYDWTKNSAETNVMVGSAAQFTIFSGNPYIPASIQSYMTSHSLASFAMGRYLEEFPAVTFFDAATTFHEAFGIKGDNAFGFDKWHYDVSYSSGQTHQVLAENNLAINRKIYAAADAVVNPANGQVVCRSTLSGLDNGCKPINLFGPNSVDQSAIPWTIGNNWKALSLRQNVWQGSLSGDLGEKIQLGAGPISFATGAEYREETAIQTVDALSPTINDFTGVRGAPASLSGKQGPYRFNNPLPFSGAYNVAEGFLEIGIPILKDLPFAQSLSADIAGRYTSYSLAGDVKTWKYGLDWQVIDDIRFRGTVSQDIRAPNLLELFNASTQSINAQLYPSSTNGQTTQSLVISKGNPNLAPEKALTFTYGVVLTPTFLEGFSLSADYYNIKLKGAIGTVSAQNEIDFCYQGQALYCSLVTPNAGTITVIQQNLNLNVLATAGYDFEASYNTELLGNPLGLRMIANHQTIDYSQAPASPVQEGLNSTKAPSWKVSLQARYSLGNFSFFAQERYTSEALMDPTKKVGVFTNNNSVPSIFYTDFTANYNLEAWGTTDQLYLSVNNVFNQDPPYVLSPPSSWSVPTDGAAYDRIGRYFSLGVRFQL